MTNKADKQVDMGREIKQTEVILYTCWTLGAVTVASLALMLFM